MNHRAGKLLLGILAGLVVIGLGAVEDWYGRNEYPSDSIAYLDVANSISRGDWALALSPYWSIGYPMILAATRWMFPPGPHGEWTAIHVVNLVIFVATYVSFLFMLKAAQVYVAKVSGDEKAESENGGVFAIGTSLFLLFEMLANNVSRPGPDLLVSGIFFLMTALSLQFCTRSRVSTAVFLGLAMGFGYIAKAAFLPLSAIEFLVILLHTLTRLPADRLPAISRLACALPALALVAIPYIAALSETLGFFTFGEAGSLNYAWNVNGLPHWQHWQGGPAPFGAPIHPTRLVLRNPPVFQFGEAAPITYPPWFNPYQCYEGYRHFFNLENQIAAVKSNLSILGQFVFRGPRSYVVFALLILSSFFLKDRRIWWNRLFVLWPFYGPSIGAIAMYLSVFVERRYLPGFLAILFTTPFLALFSPTKLLSRNAGLVLTILVAVGCTGVLAENNMEMFRRAAYNRLYTTNEQWRIGLYLTQAGLQPGDKVASVQAGMGAPCTWAYVGGLRIVAEIGNSAFDPNDQDKDYQLFLTDPAVQQTVFAVFRQAGAGMVLALDSPESPAGPGWERVPETKSWIHRL